MKNKEGMKRGFIMKMLENAKLFATTKPS